MEFGARPVYDGQSAPVPDTLRLAWFERSSAEGYSAAERGLVEGDDSGAPVRRILRELLAYELQGTRGFTDLRIHEGIREQHRPLA